MSQRINTDKKRVIALGFFDGVHIGHSALLERTRRIADRTGLIPSVITFDSNPKAIISGGNIPLINSAEDRAGLMRRIFGIEDVIFLHFDKTTGEMGWQDFIRMIISDFGARYVVAGHDYKFGHRGEGSAERLRIEAAELNIGCDILAPVKHRGQISSSTLIRKLLIDGDVRLANEFLGHMHVMTDIVRTGYRLGRKLNTPTINMRFADGVLIPALGVYASIVYTEDGRTEYGITNIGTRPTVSNGDVNVTAETHILNFRENLYGHTVRIEFCERLRPEMKFPGVEALKEQIRRDTQSARTFFDVTSGKFR